MEPVETIIQTNSQSHNNGVRNTHMSVCGYDREKNGHALPQRSFYETGTRQWHVIIRLIRSEIYFLLLIITMSHAVIMTTLRGDTSVIAAMRCFDSAQYRNWIQERCSSYILWSFRSCGMWRWNGSFRRFETSQARISLKRARRQRYFI